jgi:hypothetical protein
MCSVQGLNAIVDASGIRNVLAKLSMLADRLPLSGSVRKEVQLQINHPPC